MIAPFFFLYLNPRTRVISILYIWVVSITSMLLACLKVTQAAPRPYWVSSEIETISCAASFGNPSGHTMLSFACLMYMSLWICSNRPNHQPFAWLNDLKRFNKHVVFKVLATQFLLIMAGLTGWSRMVLGAHSLDQIIYGALLGIYVAFTWHYAHGSRFEVHLRNLMNVKDRAFSLKRKFKLGFSIIGLMFFAILIQLMLIWLRSTKVLSLSAGEIERI